MSEILPPPETGAAVIEKRPRGRPRKAAPESEEPPKEKRPRGRPKKAPVEQLTLELEFSAPLAATDTVSAPPVAPEPQATPPVATEEIFVRALGAWVRLWTHANKPPVSPNIVTCHKSCPYDCRAARSLQLGKSDAAAGIKIRLAADGKFESTECPMLSKLDSEVKRRFDEMRRKYSFEGWIEIGFKNGPPLAGIVYTVCGDFAVDLADEIWRYVLAGISAAIHQR